MIALKKLLPIVIACAIWGANWRGEAVVARIDNTSAVAVINSRSSRDPKLMHLLRCLFFFKARHSFRLEAAHIPGKDNVLAAYEVCDHFLRITLISTFTPWGQYRKFVIVATYFMK